MSRDNTWEPNLPEHVCEAHIEEFRNTESVYGKLQEPVLAFVKKLGYKTISWETRRMLNYWYNRMIPVDAKTQNRRYHTLRRYFEYYNKNNDILPVATKAPVCEQDRLQVTPRKRPQALFPSPKILNTTPSEEAEDLENDPLNDSLLKLLEVNENHNHCNDSLDNFFKEDDKDSQNPCNDTLENLLKEDDKDSQHPCNDTLEILLSSTKELSPIFDAKVHKKSELTKHLEQNYINMDKCRELKRRKLQK